MATVTFEVATPDTGADPNTSGAFTPVIGDLLVVFVQAKTTVTNPATLTSSIGGFTFTQFAYATYAATTSSLYGFVSNALVSDASSQTVTIDCGADVSQGTTIIVHAIAGITKTGLTAVRQFDVTDNGSAAGTPAVTFPAACLTGNPTLVCAANNTNPAAITEPTGWTESADTGFATPDSGCESAFRNSGHTTDTITWGGTSATVFAAMGVEIDTSAAASLVTHRVNQSPLTSFVGGVLTS